MFFLQQKSSQLFFIKLFTLSSFLPVAVYQSFAFRNTLFSNLLISKSSVENSFHTLQLLSSSISSNNNNNIGNNNIGNINSFHSIIKRNLNKNKIADTTDKNSVISINNKNDMIADNNSNNGKNDSKNDIFDTKQFDVNIPLIALNIPAQSCTIYLNELKEYLLNKPRMKRIYETFDKNGIKINHRKLIILSEKIGDDLLLTNLPEKFKKFTIDNDGIPEKYMLKLSYADMLVEDVLRIVIPKHITEIPCAFEQVGHIAHLNLREEIFEYKHIIGKVILDKNSNIRTVVNKIGSIETEFRTFPMELLAGTDSTNL